MPVTLRLSDAKDAHVRRTLSELSLSVAKSKKIVVVTGAGISCSSGIPDFRSSDGLYALVKQQYPDVVLKGRDLFDASLFRDATSTAVFYTFIAQLKQSIDSATPAPTHHFLKTLDTKKKLLRSYTQNIDGLEARAGLLGSSSSEAKSVGKGKYKIKTKDVRNVQLHGDIHRVRCMSCAAEYPCTSEHLKLFNEGAPPDCPECLQRSEARVARSARSIRVGSLRPAIVLYDEPHPLGDDIGTIQTADLARKPDMLIIMGTSLKVHGLRKLVKEFAKTVHARAASTSSTKSIPGKVIFVNKTPPAAEWSDIIDYHVEGDTDEWVTKVIEDWKRMRPSDWEVQQTLVGTDGDTGVCGSFKAAKTGLSPKVKGKPGKNPHIDNEENLPPLESMVLSTPDVSIRPPSKLRETPLSPSKRRQTASHYNDLESSPSKKRTQFFDGIVLEGAERRLLFAETTNNPPSVSADDVFDSSMQDIELEKPIRKSKASLKAVKAKTKTTSSRLISGKTDPAKQGKCSGKLTIKVGGRTGKVR